MKPLIFIFYLATFSLNVLAQHTIDFREITLQQSLEASAKENKPVLFMCYEDWCGHCEKMINEVFIDSALAAFYTTNFVCVKQDMTTGDGQKLVKRFSITSFPTFVILNKEGETLFQFLGEYKAADFLKMGEVALQQENQIPYLKNQFENNPTDSMACYKYLQSLSKGRLPTQEVVNKYFRINKDHFEFSTGNWKILSNGVSDIYSEPFQFILDHHREFSDVVTQKKVDRKIYLTSAYNLQVPANANDTTTYFKNRERAITFKNRLIDSLIFSNDLSIYEKNRQWNKYIFTAIADAENYVWNDATILRRIAEVIEVRTSETSDLQKAAKYAKRSVELKADYFNTIILAKILLRLGNKPEAKTAALEAKAFAEKNNSSVVEADSIILQCNQ